MKCTFTELRGSDREPAWHGSSRTEAARYFFSKFLLRVFELPHFLLNLPPDMCVSGFRVGEAPLVSYPELPLAVYMSRSHMQYDNCSGFCVIPSWFPPYFCHDQVTVSDLIRLQRHTSQTKDVPCTDMSHTGDQHVQIVTVAIKALGQSGSSPTDATEQPR